MTRKPTSHPLDPIHQEILNHFRRMQEGLRDAGQQFERPSAAELLTIERCGFPRTYNLNDGLGLE